MKLGRDDKAQRKDRNEEGWGEIIVSLSQACTPLFLTFLLSLYSFRARALPPHCHSFNFPFSVPFLFRSFCLSFFFFSYWFIGFGFWRDTPGLWKMYFGAFFSCCSSHRRHCRWGLGLLCHRATFSSPSSTLPSFFFSSSFCRSLSIACRTCALVGVALVDIRTCITHTCMLTNNRKNEKKVGKKTDTTEKGNILERHTYGCRRAGAGTMHDGGGRW